MENRGWWVNLRLISVSEPRQTVKTSATYGGSGLVSTSESTLEDRLCLARPCSYRVSSYARESRKSWGATSRFRPSTERAPPSPFTLKPSAAMLRQSTPRCRWYLWLARPHERNMRHLSTCAPRSSSRWWTIPTIRWTGSLRICLALQSRTMQRKPLQKSRPCESYWRKTI